MNLMNHSGLMVFLNIIKKKLENLYKIKIDYLELRNEKNLKMSNLQNKHRIFIAYFINKTRLIDNF